MKIIPQHLTQLLNKSIETITNTSRRFHIIDLYTQRKLQITITAVTIQTGFVTAVTAIFTNKVSIKAKKTQKLKTISLL